MNYEIMTLMNFSKEVILPNLEVYINQGWVKASQYRWVWVDPIVPDTELCVIYCPTKTGGWESYVDYTYRGDTNRKEGISDLSAVRRAIRAWKAFPGDKSNTIAECCGHSKAFCKKVDPTLTYV